MTSLKLSTLIAAMVMALAGCAASGSPVQVQQTATVLLAGFDQVYVAPVTADLSADIGQITYGQTAKRPVSERDLARKSADLREEMVAAFSRYFEVVDTPGTEVLIVNPHLTRLASTRPTQADIDRNERLDFSASVYGGGAALEVTFSAHDTVLAVIADGHFGDFNDGKPRLAIWADADRAFPLLARRAAQYAGG